MKEIYVLDAVNFLFRSYYAIGPMTNPKGESTNALYGFIRSVFKIIKDFSPSHLIAVFDGPQSSQSRKEIYSEYKSHRTKMPEDLYFQLLKAQEYCEIAGIPWLSVPGVEADDTIGSIARWAEKKHVKVFICTSDKDMSQLVSDYIFILNAHKENLLMDRQKVKETFGVYPEQMIDLLALMGDASDNIPGLEGIGPKTAATLLEEFGSLDALLANPEKIKGKKQEVFIKGREVALMSRQLATIDTQVEFPQEEDFFKLKMPDLEKVKTFYQDMHFMSLLKELAPAHTTPSMTLKLEEDHEKESYQLVNDEKSFHDLLNRLKKEKEISFDTETTHIRPMLANLVGIGFCTKSKEAWYVPFNGNLHREKLLEQLKELFENGHIHFFGHNVKYDLHVLCNAGIEVKHISFDTILASYLLNPQNQRHNLDLLSLEVFGKVKIPIEELIGKGKNEISMEEVPIDKVSIYCCEDVDYTWRLKKVFEEELKNREILSVLEQIEIPLLPILMRMEHHGIFVDAKKLQQMSHELAHQIEILQAEIYELAEEQFNLNSPKQLSVILFEKLKLKPPRKTTTGYSTSADVLESLRDASPIIPKILEYRTLEKLRSTYVDALVEAINPKTKRIHCTFNQSVAATGRLSSQDPNLQNIPIRTKEGKKIRKAFRPEHAHWSYVAGDYSQIELRLLAHLSEDPLLIEAFKRGDDIHAFTAAQVFNVPIEEVTPEMRHRAKAVNFGIIYGQQAFGLSQGLGIDYREADAFIETYFERYKRVKEFIEICKEGVRKTGRSVTLTGRQRPIPDIHSKNPMIRGAAERLAVNTPLQGTAADLIKIAMIRIDEKLRAHKEKAFMLLQIHDELVFEVPDEDVPRISRLVKEIMEGVYTLKVPLIVDISVGKNWGEC